MRILILALAGLFLAAPAAAEFGACWGSEQLRSQQIKRCLDAGAVVAGDKTPVLTIDKGVGSIKVQTLLGNGSYNVNLCADGTCAVSEVYTTIAGSTPVGVNVYARAQWIQIEALSGSATLSHIVVTGSQDQAWFGERWLAWFRSTFDLGV